MMRSLSVLLFGGLLAAGCATSTAAPEAQPAPETGPAAEGVTEPFPSTYTPLPSRPTLIQNATVLTAAGPRLDNASVLMRDGKIVAVGQGVTAPADALVVDGTGKWVTPGLIDSHSHLGVYPTPGGSAVSDGNEATNPNTAQVWAEQDIFISRPITSA